MQAKFTGVCAIVHAKKCFVIVLQICAWALRQVFPNGLRTRYELLLDRGMRRARQKGNMMRIIVYGVGAIGGTVAAALSLSGHEVIGIARGAQLEALQADDRSVVVGEARLVEARVAVQPEHEVLADGEPREDRALLRDQNASGVRLGARLRRSAAIDRSLS